MVTYAFVLIDILCGNSNSKRQLTFTNIHMTIKMLKANKG